MSVLDLSFWQSRMRLLGTWPSRWRRCLDVEFAGAVYICPYCRVQRTVIMLLGLLMVLPFAHFWISKYVASVIGFMGSVVAVNQNFMGWMKISKGEFTFADPLYIDPFLLSAGSLFIIIGQLWLILSNSADAKAH